MCNCIERESVVILPEYDIEIDEPEEVNEPEEEVEEGCHICGGTAEFTCSYCERSVCVNCLTCLLGSETQCIDCQETFADIERNK